MSHTGITFSASLAQSSGMSITTGMWSDSSGDSSCMPTLVARCCATSLVAIIKSILLAACLAPAPTLSACFPLGSRVHALTVGCFDLNTSTNPASASIASITDASFSFTRSGIGASELSVLFVSIAVSLVAFRSPASITVARLLACLYWLTCFRMLFHIASDLCLLVVVGLLYP